MARIERPLFSDSASGKLANLIEFRSGGGKASASPIKETKRRRTRAQRENNETYRAAHEEWMKLPTERVRIKGHWYDRRSPDWPTFYRAWPPPAAPSVLVITAVYYTRIDLAWQDNSDNETGFIVERKTGQGGNWDAVGVAGQNATAHQDAGLSMATEYHYRVKAYNITGESEYSNEASATTNLITIPTAPSGLTATAISSTRIDLAWQDNSDNETGFKIERKTGPGGNWSQIATVGQNTTAYQNTGLTENTAYYYRIRANNDGGDSGYSNEANATTAAFTCVYEYTVGQTVNGSWIADCASTHRVGRYAKYYTFSLTTRKVLILTVTSTTDGYLYLLSGHGANGQVIAQDDDSGGSGNPKITATLDPGNYTMEVTTYAAGKTGTFTVRSQESQIPNGVPSNLVATAISQSQINLTWQDNSDNETGFKIERKMTSSGSWSQIATTGANVSSYQNSGLYQYTNYYYRVRAYNTAGNSNYSNEANTTTLAGECIYNIPQGQYINGAWTADCASTHRSGCYAKYYTFTLNATTTVTILEQSGVDGYLYLLSGHGAAGGILEEDDDSGGNRNPQIIKTLDPGDYTIEVTTYLTEKTGEFSVILTTS